MSRFVKVSRPCAMLQEWTRWIVVFKNRLYSAGLMCLVCCGGFVLLSLSSCKEETRKELVDPIQDRALSWSAEQKDSISMSLAYLFHASPRNVRDSQYNMLLDFAMSHDLPVSFDERGYFYWIRSETKSDATRIGWGDEVVAHYRCLLTTGEEVDNSWLRAKPISFTVGSMVPGFNFGLMRFCVGDKGWLLVPSDLGYGAQEYGAIPQYSPLIFELEVLSARKRPGQK